MGIALATLTGDVVCGLLVYPRLAAPRLGVSALAIYESILRPLGVVMLLGMLLFAVVLFSPGISGAVVAGVITIVLFYPALRLSLGKSETAWLITRIKSFMHQAAQVSYP